MKTPKGKHVTCPACGEDMIVNEKNSLVHHKTPICDMFALHLLIESLLIEIFSEKRGQPDSKMLN